MATNRSFVTVKILISLCNQLGYHYTKLFFKRSDFMFQAVRGMQDNLPSVTPYWESLEHHLRILAKCYAYQEIRFPIIEHAHLFEHSIGVSSDIVEKEMYLFQDSKGRTLCLRPEGTASCIRTAIEHQLLLTKSVQKFWYLGPMFRRERPQKGRYRQFHQFGIEAFGASSPEIDAEIILMSHRLWKQLNIADQVTLEINSLGDRESRNQHRKALVHYFERHVDLLDEDSKKRLLKNPLRILDSKNPKMASVIREAPQLLEYLDPKSLHHFQNLQNILKTFTIPFTINPHLVRGLDYYNSTVFEWVVKDIKGAQNTVCAGGRYDSLVEQLGGAPKPAIGFAIGLERLIELWMQQQDFTLTQNPDIYIIRQGALAMHEGFVLAEKLRDAFSNLHIMVDYSGDHFSQQFRRANANNASIAIVLGDNEIQSNYITLRDLQSNRAQHRMQWPELVGYLKKHFK